jgi:hypothetical protein
MASGAISESLPPLNAKALVARLQVKTKSQSLFLINNTIAQPAWQEIVGFS